MNNFKVGDKVVLSRDGVDRIAGSFYKRHGKRPYYTVTSLNPTLGWLTVGGENSVGWYCSCFDRVKYTREDVEKAMDVFEHFDISKSKSSNYASPKLGVSLYGPKGEFLKLAFPSAKEKKLTQLKEQVAELQNTINKLEKEINV